MTVRIQTEGFDAGAELNAFTDTVAGAGAVVSFTGVVRDVDVASSQWRSNTIRA